MKLKSLILLSILVIVLLFLCLKTTMFEYFNEQNQIDEMINNFDKKYNLKQIKQKCNKEYKACIKDEKSKSAIIKLINSQDLSSVMLIEKPKQLVNLRDCVMKHLIL